MANLHRRIMGSNGPLDQSVSPRQRSSTAFLSDEIFRHLNQTFCWSICQPLKRAGEELKTQPSKWSGKDCNLPAALAAAVQARHLAQTPKTCRQCEKKSNDNDLWLEPPALHVITSSFRNGTQVKNVRVALEDRLLKLGPRDDNAANS